MGNRLQVLEETEVKLEVRNQGGSSPKVLEFQNGERQGGEQDRIRVEEAGRRREVELGWENSFQSLRMEMQKRTESEKAFRESAQKALLGANQALKRAEEENKLVLAFVSQVAGDVAFRIGRYFLPVLALVGAFFLWLSVLREPTQPQLIALGLFGLFGVGPSFFLSIAFRKGK